MSFSFSQKKHSSGARLMTEGNIAKQLILFALPLLVGNLFQQLYNAVDPAEVRALAHAPDAIDWRSELGLAPDAPLAAFVGRIIIMAVRTVPAFVYGLMFIRVTGPGAFAGLLTMSLCSVGMVSKMYIEAIEDLDVRVLESLDAAGCTTWQKIRYGILPQLMPNFASTAIYRFDINLRDATVLGLVGAGGIGAPLIFAMNSYRWEEAGAILAGLIVLVLIVEWISTKIRVKLARG